MKKAHKKLANYGAQVQMDKKDADQLPLYCMISPTADDAVEDRDSSTVTSNRS